MQSLLFSGILLLACSWSMVAQAGDIRHQVDNEVQAFLKERPYAGLVVGLITPETQQVWGYGSVTLRGKQQTPDGNTLFEIGSVTKVLTGLLLADLVNRGKVRVDDPVSRYLPANWKVPRRDNRDITLLHLATHTSSLPRVPPSLMLLAAVDGSIDNPYATFTRKMLQNTLCSLKLTRVIGSQYRYSNLGVGLLGLALADATNATSYEALLRQRILSPIGMHDTGITLSETQLQQLAPGMNGDGEPTSRWDFDCLEACGGVRSNVNDILKLLRANLHLEQTPLGEAFRLAQQPWREKGRSGLSVGLCWMLTKEQDPKFTMIWHNGGTGGYRSFLAVVPEHQLGLVILTNTKDSIDMLAVDLIRSLIKPGAQQDLPPTSEQQDQRDSRQHS